MSPFPNLKKLKHRTGLRKKSRKMTTMTKRPVGGFIKVGETIEERQERCAVQTAGATLPERQVVWALEKLGIPYVLQQRVGGANWYAQIDIILYLGSGKYAIRVQGSYWHEMFDRQATDILQASRLHAEGFTVVDMLEAELRAAADVGCDEIIKYVKRKIYGG